MAREGRLPPAWRKLALALHVGASVGWLGALLAYLPFDAAASFSEDEDVLRMAFPAMDLIVRRVIVPLAIAAFATGLVVSLGTPWGLFRHYWVVLSLVLTAIALVVLLVEARVVAELAAVAREASPQELRALPGTLPHSVGGLVVLATVLALNVAKPRGLTAYGWRRQQEEAR